MKNTTHGVLFSLEARIIDDVCLLAEFGESSNCLIGGAVVITQTSSETCTHVSNTDPGLWRKRQFIVDLKIKHRPSKAVRARYYCCNKYPSHYEKTHPRSILQVTNRTQLAKMSIDPKFAELTADALEIFLKNTLCLHCRILGPRPSDSGPRCKNL